MEQKLQALLDKIYHEGVEKGQDIASAIVADAERKAEKMMEEAKKEAADIRKKAREEAEELRRNVVSELRLSAEQSLSALRQKISRLITAGAIAEPIRKSMEDEEFLKGIIEALIQKWDPLENSRGDLSVLLPPEKGEQLFEYFSAKARTMLNKTVQVNFDHKLDNGFRIGPANGGYVLSFTDKDFETFFSDYLRPQTKELLFGKGR